MSALMEGAHAGAPLQEEAFVTPMSAKWYEIVRLRLCRPK
jgi:hypothetical protein